MNQYKISEHDPRARRLRDENRVHRRAIELADKEDWADLGDGLDLTNPNFRNERKPDGNRAVKDRKHNNGGFMKSLVLTAFISTTALLAVSGCSHKPVESDTAVADSQWKTPSSVRQLNNSDLVMTHFALDSANLTDTGKTVLRQDAQALKDFPDAKIEAQGYCDDRGSVEYNLALGQRRALAVKGYLQSLGIAANRITTASFGKSNPLDSSDNETAWKLNRRASFVIQPQVALE